MNQFKKVAFYTLGCKLNFSETSTIARLFEEAGFAKVDFEDSQPFILDAKNYGNIARYIAHSCDPNLFSQK